MAIKEGYRYVNTDLDAYVVFQQPKNPDQEEFDVLFGFFEEDEEHLMPLSQVTYGYHYDKGGENYRALCEWIERKAEEEEDNDEE